MVRWAGETDAIDWTEIELENIHPYTAYDLLWLNSKQRLQLNITNTYLTTTLKIWNLWKPTLVRRYSKLITLTHHGRFAPDLEKILQGWRFSGLTTLKDITHKGHVLQKMDLETKTYSSILWLHYLQLRSKLSQKCFKTDLTNI